MTKALKILFAGAFALYILLLLYVLFLRGRGNSYSQSLPLSEYMQYAVNVTPFETIKGFWRALRENRINTDIALLNIFGNVALFVPFGFLLPVNAPRLRALWKCAAVSLAAIIAAETIQLFFRVGSFDVDDVILNMIGILIGYILYKISCSAYKKTRFSGVQR